MAKKSKFQIIAEYLALRVVFGGIAILPRRAAHAAGVALGSLAYRLLKKQRSRGIRNLEIAFPEMSAAERERVIHGTFRTFGRMFSVLAKVRSMTAANIGKYVDTDPSILLNPSRGTIVISPHLGSPDLMVIALYYSTRRPMALVAREMDNPLIDRYLTEGREWCGHKVVTKRNIGRIVPKLLSDNGAVAMLPDVNSSLERGVFVPFFGIPACTPTGTATLALRSNAVILPVWCVWDRKTAKYRVAAGKPIEPIRTGDHKQDIIETTAAYNLELEKLIRTYPDRYLWTHRRWKTRPPGEPELY
ncbi:MAG: lysophospholipid acyltransferase family protein [Chloracidobacterium sp.]|nr:lysophospholipid acyltransferase family protein [Chloracidobacterium sp.]MCC6825108.1 lysophospholipid acyltransferase family protein [Acidobacteriota bacterium]MCO5334295.1 lysophospholipid acyltransferase family protein [Pyrinomonadaceae bacterium]